MVNLRLHRGYRLPAIRNRKVGQQFVGPLQITRRIDKLAYKLDIPRNWKIHPVVSVAHLEPATTQDMDPFRRPRPNHPGPVFVEGDTETDKSYEIETLLSK